MRFGKTEKERVAAYNQWHQWNPWFAWRPVFVPQAGFVWLEHLERRPWFHYDGYSYEYRLKQNDAI